jgi:rare lipoprotein A
MLQTPCRVLYVTALAALLAACATEPPSRHASGGASSASGGGIYKVGEPYQIGDTWYYPREQPDYDETGVASWYGPTFYGKSTANGELYDGDGLTAAHRTLPMPVNVRVTNLDNGKSVVVRVNDRGPYAKGRIIDVSRHAAELLGFVGQGTAKVRVTYLGRADLPNGQPPPSETPVAIAKALPPVPAEKIETASLDTVPGAVIAAPVRTESLPAPAPAPATEAPPAAQLQPTGEVERVPVPAVTHLYVQAGAFSTYENASRLKTRLAGDLFISPIERNGHRLYRVRSGPYDDLESADAALARLTGLGNNDAEIVVDQ